MSATAPRAPGTYLRTRKGVLERQCKECRRWKPQDTLNFMLQNKIRKKGKEPTQIWDCRCSPCRRAMLRITTRRAYAQRAPVRHIPQLPATPPELDFGNVVLRQLLGGD